MTFPPQLRNCGKGLKHPLFKNKTKTYSTLLAVLIIFSSHLFISTYCTFKREALSRVLTSLSTDWDTKKAGKDSEEDILVPTWKSCTLFISSQKK